MYIVPGKDYVCKLKKGIYDKAAKVWNDQLNEILRNYGFKQSEADPCLCVKTENEEKIYLIVYVDDILIESKSKSEEVGVFLKKHFHLNDLGLRPTKALPGHGNQKKRGILLQTGKIHTEDIQIRPRCEDFHWSH